MGETGLGEDAERVIRPHQTCPPCHGALQPALFLGACGRTQSLPPVEGSRVEQWSAQARVALGKLLMRLQPQFSYLESGHDKKKQHLPTGHYENSVR